MNTCLLFLVVKLFHLSTQRQLSTACLSCRLKFLSSHVLTHCKCGRQITKNTTNWKRTSMWLLALALASTARPSTTPDTRQTMIRIRQTRSMSGWFKMHQVSRKLSIACLNTQTSYQTLKLWNSQSCISSNGGRQFHSRSLVRPASIKTSTTWTKSTASQAMEEEATKASG